MDPKDIFRQFCKNNDMRYTPERGLIIDEIYRTHDHFDVDQLFLRIRNRFPKIKLSRASIYRTMPLLINAGLLREALTQVNRIYYDQTLGHSHHDHLKCLKCGSIFEFYSETIDEEQEALCKKRKFMITSHMHVIYGYCYKCK